MILVIDNYDSFTYNLVQFIGELGANPVVHRNDRITLEQIDELAPAGMIVSPGPGHPEEGGISVDLIRSQSGKVPILGVCLGHQSIGFAMGGKIGRVHPLHGKSSEVTHDGSGLFAGVSSPFEAGRYHSLVVEREDLPETLVVTAETADGIIMGLRHSEHPTYGVQFHPESILTAEGKVILSNFLESCGEIQP